MGIKYRDLSIFCYSDDFRIYYHKVQQHNISIFTYTMESNLSIYIEACLMFLPDQDPKSFAFYELVGGINNWTKGVNTPSGNYVVRIYNNGKNLHKVRLEHEMLLLLEDKEKIFETPRPLRMPGTTKTIGVLKEGYPCCLIRKIEGALPKEFSRKGMQNFGEAVSQLSGLLAQIKLSQQPIIKPYFDLCGVHSAVVSKQNFIAQVSSQKYNSVRSSVDQLLQYITMVEQKIVEFKQKNFPMQLIHGDVHTDNILMKGDTLTGILDFEFVAEDWRAMQFAICLSKYVNMDNFGEIICDFHRGYCRRGNLTEQELLAVPWLIILRLVSNFVYFAGRAMSGEDTVDFCKQKVVVYEKRIKKLLPSIEEFQKDLLKY